MKEHRGQTKMNDIPAESGVVGSALASGITHSKSGRLIACMRKICRNSCPADYHQKLQRLVMIMARVGNQATFWVQGTTECQIAELSDGRLVMNIGPYIGWNGTRKCAAPVVLQRSRLSWSPAEPADDLIDYSFADEGYIVSDPEKWCYLFYASKFKDAIQSYDLYIFGDAQTWSARYQQLFTLVTANIQLARCLILGPRGWR